MGENLSEVAGILSGAPLGDAAETPDKPEPEEKPDESPEPAIGEPDTPSLPAAAEPSAEMPAAALTVKALAERLEIRPQDLYRDLMIDIGSGEPLSLSAIKDAGAKLHKAEQILTDSETSRRDAENELLRRQHAMSQRKPTDAEMAAADSSWKAFVVDENAKTMSIISAWKAPEQQQADLRDMAEMLGSYGVSGAEIARYADHRYVKQLYDHMILKRRLDAAGASEVTTHAAPVSKSKRKSVPKPREKIVSELQAGKISQTEAVAALIAGG